MGLIHSRPQIFSKLISHYATKTQLLIKSFFLFLPPPPPSSFSLPSPPPTFFLLLFFPFSSFLLTNLTFVRDKIGLRRQSQQILCFSVIGLEMDMRLGTNTSCQGNLVGKKSQCAEGDGVTEEKARSWWHNWPWTDPGPTTPRLLIEWNPCPSGLP